MRSWMSLSSRARVAAIAIAVGLAALLGAGPAWAQARFNRIVIDTSPVAATGTSQLAENIRPILAAGVMRAMAGSVDPRDKNAPTLIITVRSLQLAAFGGSDDGGDGFRFGGGVSSSDYLDTVVTVVRGRTVLSTFPILINQPSSAGGPWFAQPNEDRRVAQLGVTLGEWVRRKVGA